MARIKKTNAMRLLDRSTIAYQVHEYEVIEGKTDGISVAKMLGQDTSRVFKTLVTKASSKAYLVFVIPVDQELDLKKAAKAAGEKKVEMIPMKDLLPVTGYIHGGCSPVGMKKAFKTYIHKTAKDQEIMMCSGGKVGVQIELRVDDLIQITHAALADLIA